MRSPIRVLEVVGSLDRGGAETWLVQCLRTLDPDRYRFDFLVHSERPGAYEPEVRALGAGVLVCPFPSSPWSYARSFARILRARGPYDIVHAHLYLFSALPLWVAERARVRARIAHMYPVTDTRAPTPMRRVYRAVAARLLTRSATLVLTDSKSSLLANRGLVGDRVATRIVRPGIDLAPYARAVDRIAIRAALGVPSDRPLITYVARFAPHKNHVQVLRAADRFAADDRPVHFALAGSHGPLLGRVRADAATRSNVSVHVGLERVADLLLASDLFFMPSTEEGFGIVVVEAAAAGLPVVASDLLALRETVPPACRRYLFPPDDDDAAAAALGALLDDEALRMRLAAESRSWAGAFDIGRSARALADAYDDAVRT